MSLTCSEYDPTQSVYCNTYPWLFPGGVGYLYDIKRGKRCPKEWGSHLLHYYDGHFINDQMFSLFVFNSIERHENDSTGSYFFTSAKFWVKIHLLSNSCRIGWQQVMIVIFKFLGIIPVISKGVTITGGQRHRNLKVGSSIMSLEAVHPQHFL